MFIPLPAPKEMAVWDKAAIAFGLPELLLMENASREALHVLCAETGDVRGKKILLFMGGGNNGGDAACLARHLHDAGSQVLVLHSRPLRASTGVSARHIRLARRAGVAFRALPALLRGKWPLLPLPELYGVGAFPHIIIDGLLGTGFTGTLREKELALIQEINRLADRSFVLALDIPSGLSGLTGRPCPEAVRAHATVTFEAAKPGLVLPEAAPYVGRLHVRPIGIPRTVREAHPASFQMLPREAGAHLPVPQPLQHKGLSGRVLVIGGSNRQAGAGGQSEGHREGHSEGQGGGLCGAPHLAALAALRSGAGLVTVAAPSGLCAAIKGHCADIMTLPLGDTDESTWSAAQVAALLPFLRRCDAVVLGPGMGRTEGAAAFCAALLSFEGERPPFVVDADALAALAAAPELCKALRPQDILTPHPGEAALLLKTGVERIQEDRFAALGALTALAPASWLLKGAGSLIGAAGQPVTIAPFAEPNLAVGGSGDVLSGCIAALLAQAHKPSAETSHRAACLAVLLHAEAGRFLRQSFPMRGNTATDIADSLPKAYAGLCALDRARAEEPLDCGCLNKQALRPLAKGEREN